LDPPYWRRKLYKFNFSDQDFTDLDRRLREVKGKFILSLDDHPEVRRLFDHWNIEQVQLAYTAQQTTGKRYAEVLITNFEPRPTPEPLTAGK
jgi:DNA adenine methylase